MRAIWILLAVMIGSLAAAQPQTASISVPLAALRAIPDETSALAGSAYASEVLYVIGRNADGRWLNVHRPMSPEASVWVRRDLVQFSGDVSLLPLTDTSTGVTGSTPITETGFAIHVTRQTDLLAQPDRFAAVRGTLPTGVIVPVISRTPNNVWLKVNYLGTEGWIAEYITRTSLPLHDIPTAPETEGVEAYAAFDVIDPALQLAQIERILAWLRPAHVLASDVAFYWRQLINGETKECLPPAALPAYDITAAMIAELPELRHQTRLLTRATEDINRAISLMRACGIHLGGELHGGYSAALSARGIFDRTIRRMEALQEDLLGISE